MICAYFQDSGNLSRPGVSLMSDQTLMELFVADFNDTAALRNDDEDFLDITEWYGVAINQDGYVESIRIYNKDYMIFVDDDDEDDTTFLDKGGKVRFDCLPRSLHALDLTYLDLDGTIETEKLPPCMRELKVYSNRLTGIFSIPGLPQRIEKINIQENLFTGPLEICELPKSIKRFYAQNNRFSGSLELTRLPNDIEILSLGDNAFSGSISLECLPQQLKCLRLDKNAFSQDCVVVGKIPLRLERIALIACGISRAVDQSGNKLVDPRVLFTRHAF